MSEQYFWVCLTCNKWSCHIGNAPLLYIGYENRVALSELTHEHEAECPEAAFTPVSEVTQRFRRVA